MILFISTIIALGSIKNPELEVGLEAGRIVVTYYSEESSFKNSVYRYSDYVEGYGKNIVSEAGSDEIVKLLRDFL